MAAITSVALATRDTQTYVGGITNVAHSFNATNLAAVVTNGDRIEIMTLPANSQIVGVQYRVTGTMGITSITYVSVVEPTGNVIALTPTSGAPAAPSIALNTMMTQTHQPITSVTATRTVNLEVTTGTFAATTASVAVYVGVDYAFYP